MKLFLETGFEFGYAVTALYFRHKTLNGIQLFLPWEYGSCIYETIRKLHKSMCQSGFYFHYFW